MTILLDFDVAIAELTEEAQQLLEGDRTVGLHSISAPASVEDHQVEDRRPAVRRVTWCLSEANVVEAITLAVGSVIVETHTIKPLIVCSGDTLTVTFIPSTGASA